MQAWVRGGDRLNNFTDVYNEYASQVYRYLVSITRNKALAEELTQETFYKALLKGGTYRGSGSMYVWLCQIAKHLYYNDCKKNKRVSPKAPDAGNAGGEDIALGILRKEQTMRVHQALHVLPEPFKEVFTLRVFGELKFREIAELFGKTESWAKMTFYRAKEQLVSEMEDGHEQ